MIQSRVYEYLLKEKDIELIGVKDDKEAFLTSQVLSYVGLKPFVLPDFRANFGDDLLPFSDEIRELLNSLDRYYSEKSSKKVLVVPIRTILSPLPKKELFSSYELEFASTLDIDNFKNMLYTWGYRFVDVVEGVSEVSFRGDVIDIFSPNLNSPIRVSLFDDEIESIRYFECETQKSIKEEIESVIIKPALFALDSKNLRDIEERINLIESDSFEKDIHSLGLWALEDLADSYIEKFKIVLTQDLSDEIEEIELFNSKAKRLKELEFMPSPKVYKDLVVSDIPTFLEFHKDKKITLLARNELLLRQAGLDTKEISFKTSELIVNLISSTEIILSLNKITIKRRKKRATILLDELRDGDFVVHEKYGIGIFKGLTNVTVLGATRDFVVIEYQGEEKVLLPVENLDIIDRFVAESGNIAVVDRLGKGSFARLKEKTRQKLFAIAKEIVDIAAKREMIEGACIDVKKEEILRFQNDSGFEYTQDQKKAIDDIFRDLSSGKVMDRLLSGDVGFGKTEVAMNAIFATALSGYQTLFIAPTTLLSTQHYKTLYERFKKYGIRVEKLDRFTHPKIKSDILRDLKNGSLKVCIGTHTLFDKELKNPALVVVDEEHKFGVKQKEKLKALSSSLHLLSMSATPIPRSLNMALSSIKTYSTLLTPPLNREDIRTFVKESDEKVIKEAILREIRRGGQVFFVHNRIASIENRKKDILSLLPKLKILVLHSKIQASTTEKEMLKFQEKEYDLLLSTSIIESGIHIPNVNTIIIDNSENFGMADLHQLRGRVGRSSKEGYCYFLVKERNALSEASKKRLVALESNSYLGSGSVLAYHDLEIRGGGNLIGEAQSGHIKNIGYSLYLKMLEDAINELLNRAPVKNREVDIKLSVDAYISSEYIREDRVRLELYRRLSKCESISDVLDIEEEMLDRFNSLDTPTKQFLDIINIKILSSQKGVVSISNYAQNITIKYENDKKELLKARSKDDDDILDTILSYLRRKDG